MTGEAFERYREFMMRYLRKVYHSGGVPTVEEERDFQVDLRAYWERLSCDEKTLADKMREEWLALVIETEKAVLPEASPKQDLRSPGARRTPLTMARLATAFITEGTGLSIRRPW